MRTVSSAFLNGVEATLRTNCYQTADDGGPKSYLSIKLESSQIDDLPLPRPLREILFTHHGLRPLICVADGRLEAVYAGLTGQDFRTEVLGPVKAQMKMQLLCRLDRKAVLHKRPPSAGAAKLSKEGMACYKMFMSGMLDITDNHRGNKVEVRKRGPTGWRRPIPRGGRRQRQLFSDIANGVSAQYGHWLETRTRLGQCGIRSQKNGYTARGAWVVKRHFREIGKDIQVRRLHSGGVGDMSGDVFGNGMLLQTYSVARCL